MSIVIVEIWFEIANMQILPVFNRVTCPPQDSGGILSFHISIFLYNLYCVVFALDLTNSIFLRDC